MEGRRRDNGPLPVAPAREGIVVTVETRMVSRFGSAARATITPESDGDALVARDGSVLETMKARGTVCLPADHPPAHMVPATGKWLGHGSY